jgi:hypothetical protein
MSTWFYQMDQRIWSPERYRLEIWEGETWAWPARRIVAGGERPGAGDTVAFFYTRTGGDDPGFYGWAVVLEWFAQASHQLKFRPAAPSDKLKMFPWGDEQAMEIANSIRGKVKQGTLWLVRESLVERCAEG